MKGPVGPNAFFAMDSQQDGQHCPAHVRSACVAVRVRTYEEGLYSLSALSYDQQIDKAAAASAQD